MKFIVYDMPDCTVCARVKAVLLEGGVPVEVRSLERLQRGEYKDIEAMTQLIIQGHKAPVVLGDGKPIDWSEVEEIANGCNF